MLISGKVNTGCIIIRVRLYIFFSFFWIWNVTHIETYITSCIDPVGGLIVYLFLSFTYNDDAR